MSVNILAVKAKITKMKTLNFFHMTVAHLVSQISGRILRWRQRLALEDVKAIQIKAWGITLAMWRPIHISYQGKTLICSIFTCFFPDTDASSGLRLGRLMKQGPIYILAALSLALAKWIFPLADRNRIGRWSSCGAGFGKDLWQTRNPVLVETFCDWKNWFNLVIFSEPQ